MCDVKYFIFRIFRILWEIITIIPIQRHSFSHWRRSAGVVDFGSFIFLFFHKHYSPFLKLESFSIAANFQCNQPEYFFDVAKSCRFVSPGS